jgi:hypothetical protein
VDFREVSALLHGAAVDIRAVSLSESSVTLIVAAADSERLIVFGGVDLLRCRMAASSAHTGLLETVGLEKLGAGEVWRLYAQTAEGAELELSARTIVCDGVEVTGVGRSYRH